MMKLLWTWDGPIGLRIFADKSVLNIFFADDIMPDQRRGQSHGHHRTASSGVDTLSGCQRFRYGSRFLYLCLTNGEHRYFQVPKMCEVMAGEFHDQEALHNRGGGAGRRAAMRRGLFSTNTKPAEGTSEEGSHGATRMNTGASSFSRQTTETRDEVPEQSSAAVGEGRIGDLSPIHRLLASLGPRWYHSKARRG